MTLLHFGFTTGSKAGIFSRGSRKSWGDTGFRRYDGGVCAVSNDESEKNDSLLRGDDRVRLSSRLLGHRVLQDNTWICAEMFALTHEDPSVDDARVVPEGALVQMRRSRRQVVAHFGEL